MKFIIILLLMASVAAACPPGELETWVCDKPGDVPIGECKWVAECTKVSMTAPKSVSPCAYGYTEVCADSKCLVYECKPDKCIGVKVYEIKTTRNSVCMQCDKYICEGNGYEGEECYDSCSFSNSRYDQLRKMWGK